MRILLARGAELILGQDYRVDVRQLWTMGVRLEGAVLRDEVLPALPEPDESYFQTRARLNERTRASTRRQGSIWGTKIWPSSATACTRQTSSSGC